MRPARVIARLLNASDIPAGTRTPLFPDGAIQSIIYESWKRTLSFE
jgi:hypothetical protein